jgi:hypothetical protein
MKRIAAILAATAAAAAVAAAITMPAGADEASSADAKFVSCLQSLGLGIPAGTRGDDIKRWMLAQADRAAVDRAVAKCKPQDDGQPPQELVACLRAHGLNPPAGLTEFKPWLGRIMATAQGESVARACKLAMAPPDDKAGGPAPCGGGKIPDAKQPEAAPELAQ